MSLKPTERSVALSQMMGSEDCKPDSPPHNLKMQGADYDDRTLFLGEWGPFQQIVFFLLCFSIIPNGFTGLSIVFMGDTPSHHCHIPAHYNITVQWRNVSIPWEDHGGTKRLSRCTRYRVDLIKSYSDKGYEPWIDVNVSEIEQEVCTDGWEYDRQQYTSTIVSEVCMLPKFPVVFINSGLEERSEGYVFLMYGSLNIVAKRQRSL